MPDRLPSRSAPVAAVYWRRRAGAVAVSAALVALGLIAFGGGKDGPGGNDRAHRAGATAERASAPAVRPRPPQLPRGGRRIFPHFRVVAYYGAPQDPQLGELGIGTPDVMAKRLARQARPYRAGGRPELPAMELLADIANGSAGDDGLYRTRQSDAVIRRYLHAARRARALLILDIQPGHAGFLTEARHLERWLREPDVSLALDPEWHVPAGTVPGRVIGSVSAREVNALSYWLAEIVTRYDLPEKLLVVHRFTHDMIDDEPRLKSRPGVALTVNVDGFGTRPVKVAKYRSFAHRPPSPVHNGFKLFYHEDTAMMRPGQVLRMRPRPELIVYE